MAFDLQFVDSIGQIYDPITDTFTRTVADSWGTADTGQVWTTSGGSASDYSVDGIQGLQSLGAVNVLHSSLIDVGFTDGTVTVDIVNPVVPTGAIITHWVLIRAADLSNYYYAALDIPTSAAATLALRKRVGGTLTGLTSAVPVGTHFAVTRWRVVLDIHGSALRAKAWRRDLVAEPAGWQVAATDTDLTSGTQAGALARLETGNTNTLPVVITYDNFSVTSPTSVRLDLNDDLPWRTLGEGTEFGTPPLRRAVVSTLMQDGEHVPAAAYGNRLLSLTLDCQLAVTDFDGAATAFQELSRELDRPGNFLRYRPGTTEPVFFRTLRSDYTSVVWDAVLRRASVSVLAEPFAFGLPAFLPAVTVYNDPAEGTTLNANPFFETDVSNWTGLGGTFVRSTAQFHQGVASGLLTPDGVSATSRVTSNHVAASAGIAYRGSAWVRCATSRNVQLEINWYDAGNAFLSSSSTGATVTANTWTLLDFTATAPAGTGFAAVQASMYTTPPITDLLYVDEARLRQSGGVGGMCFDVTGVKGDVPAATKITAGSTFLFNNQVLTATRRRGTPSGLQFAFQAEVMTQGTDTTTQPNDATMSGSGNNFSRCTFATATMVTRLTLAAFPATVNADGRGTYRVLARIRQSVAVDVINLQVQIAPYGSGVGVTTGTAATNAVSTSPFHVDLGLVSVPFGADPITDGPSGVELDVAQYEIRLRAERVSGTGTLDIDYLLFIPADDELAIVNIGNDSGGSGYVFDSHHDMVWAVRSSGAVDSSADTVPTAGLPSLRPGETNRIYLVLGVGMTAVLTATCAVDVAYWPRYVTVRPAST